MSINFKPLLSIFHAWMLYHAFFFSLCVFAQPSTARLLSLMKTIKPHSIIDVGIQIKLKKGWHTYWENPGDAGYPMEVQWTLPSSIKPSPLYWPRPLRLRFGGQTYFGYKKDVLILSKITVPAHYKKKILPIQVYAKWLVCKNVCIPVEKTLVLKLPVSQKGLINAKNKKIFLSAKKQLPQKSSIRGKSIQNKILLSSKHKFQLIDFFPLAPFSSAAPQVSKNTNSSYTLSFSSPAQKSTAWPALVLYKRNQKIQSTQVQIQVQKKGWLSLAAFLLMAFAGGLILNFMPCVLPIVFLKFYHAVRSRRLVISSLMYSLGVTASFTGLALLIDLFKTGSQSLGWGFQMQSPLFIVFLILFFTFIGLSFLDILYIPKFLKPLRWDSKTWIGGLFSGLLAVLSATPCTAPFMGTAVGFAFSQSRSEVILIFTCLGLGMSSPYIILSFFPKLLKKIPHPGKWNKNFKQLLALPILATVVWLIYILAHIHISWVFPILTALIGYGFAFWILKNKVHPKRYALLLLILSLLFTFYPGVFSFRPRPPALSNVWKPFSPFKLDQLRSKNQPVLVNITAKWCITCRLNEWTTFKSKKVLDFLTKNNITLIQGDWTARDNEILNFLKMHNRAGIPFTVFFPSKRKKPILLPELLTPQIFINSIQPHL